MKNIVIFFIMICTAAIAGCSYIEPFYVLNSSDAEVMVKAAHNEYSIAPGSTKKIRGLHYHGATISNGVTEISYNNALTDMVPNWHQYSDTYICRNFFGSRINVEFTHSNELLLLPCKKGGAVKVISPDKTLSLYQRAPNKFINHHQQAGWTAKSAASQQRGRL
ncbi:hypothetical protein [Microbulbifer sp. JMSA003]|uniref:hypothetical protein n=1 Tax=Microbulbifer sp. JMSA003 TaxID=3243369 RepID=UPI00403A6796